MKFTGVTFGDAIDFVRDVTGVNIHVNWKALEQENVTADTPVNIRLRAVTLRKVLNLLLSEASGGDALTFYVDDGVVEITTRELADKKVYTQDLPVDDLLMDVPDFTEPRTSASSPASDQAPAAGRRRRRRRQRHLRAERRPSRDAEDANTTTRDERGEELVALDHRNHPPRRLGRQRRHRLHPLLQRQPDRHRAPLGARGDRGSIAITH